jgi:hypothetical protein
LKRINEERQERKRRGGFFGSAGGKGDVRLAKALLLGAGRGRNF